MSDVTKAVKRQKARFARAYVDNSFDFSYEGYCNMATKRKSTKASTSDMHVVACDSGNGFCNAVKALSKSTKSVAFPSVRSQATGNTLGLDGLELRIDWVRWNEQLWIVGDDVHLSSRSSERHQGRDRYGDEFHQFIVATALARLGCRGNVDLSILLPPGMYAERKEIVREVFTAHNEVEIQLRDDKQVRKMTYERVRVWPESVAGMANFVFDSSGNISTDNTLAGRVLCIDIGSYTLDTIVLENASLNVEMMQFASEMAGGLRANILEPVLRAVSSSGRDFSVATVDHVDSALRKGLATGDFRLKLGRSIVDLQGAFEQSAQVYANWILTEILDTRFGGLRAFDGLIVIGGGTNLVMPYLRKWHGDILIDFQSSPETKTIQPHDANAHGALRLALWQRNQEMNP